MNSFPHSSHLYGLQSQNISLHGSSPQTRMYSFWENKVRFIKTKWELPWRTRSDLLANVFWQVLHTKSRGSGIGVFVGRPLGIETGGSGLRPGGLFAAAVDEAGAEAVDFGEADTDTEWTLSESESVLFSFCSPAAS